MALYAIGVIAILAGADALAHSYTGLYGRAVHHRLDGWQAMSWPAEIDVFLVVGELALYIAYLDAWPGRQRVWPWVTAATGLIVSVTGNVGHIQPLPDAPVTLTDRLTAAISPVAAFAGLMVGLLVLKMSGQGTGEEETVPASAHDEPEASWSLLADATEIFRAARIRGATVSQRALASQLRQRGHRFSNSQLSEVVSAADPSAGEQAA